MSVLCATLLVVKMVEADCVRAIFASFVSVARQGGGAPQSAVDHLKLLLKLAPKGRTGHHGNECQHLAFPSTAVAFCITATSLVTLTYVFIHHR